MSSTAMPGGFSSPQVPSALVSESMDGLTMKAVRALASLKLTCALFVLAMMIVFVGSLAQSRRDVWQVMEEYFRTFVAHIQVRDLFPPSMFGDLGDTLAVKLGAFNSIPFPGGWTIGILMLVNLVTAHALKFKVRAEGARLVGGMLLVVFGLVMTGLVVWTGNHQTGVEYGDTVLSPTAIWYLLLAVLGISGVASLATAVLSQNGSMLSRAVLIAIAVILLGVLAYFVQGGEAARLNLSSMRILWQLLKGGACSLVLLLGSNMLFDKRGGIALLHFGVAMLMVSELQVGYNAKENMLSLVEGETSSFIRDIRERELAIVRQGPAGQDDVVVVSEARLEAAGTASEEASNETISPGQIITLPESLPFDVVVRRFHRNSRLRALTPDDKSTGEEGLGSFAAPEPLEPVTGMDETHDQSAVYIDLVERDSGKQLKSLLVAQNVSELRGAPLAEKATVDGKDYFFYLRFQRNYCDYNVKLLDVSRTNYVGSSTPRDYRSVIQIRDSKDGPTEEFTLWMNNPLRYKGETFYQSSYQELPDGTEASTISVVKNTGWMLPYIACMMVSFGMFAQFGQTLLRFLNRTERSSKLVNSDPTQAALKATPVTPAIGAIVSRPGFAPAMLDEQVVLANTERTPAAFSVGIPLVVGLLFVAWLAKGMRTPTETADSMNLYSFAQLPIAWSGRAQPIDSLARTQLLVTSHKSTFEGEMDRVELNDPKRREKIIAAFSKGWPEVPADKLQDFNGSYVEWIDQIATITASGKEAVEERMRPVMVRRMAAVQWFLDVVSRPEVAERHRVIKIEDDQVLSLLGLEKRGGMTYSMAEIRKNLKDIFPILEKAHQKQKDDQENSMTTMERRVSALFDTVSRLNRLAEGFSMDKPGDLLTSYIGTWRIFEQLGTQPAVMAVPTGSMDEQRSWETFVASNSLRQLNDELKRNNVKTFEEFLKCIHGESLSKEMVERSLTETWNVLQNGTSADEPPTTDPVVVQKRATERLAWVEASYPRSILTVMSEAQPGATLEQIIASVTPEKAREVATRQVSSVMVNVFALIQETDPEDQRLKSIPALTARFRQQGLSEAEMETALVDECARFVWDDLQERAGHLMPGGESSESFDKSAAAMSNILTAWQNADVELFNNSIKDYQAQLTSGALPHVNMGTVSKEAWFNLFEPFIKTIYIYVPVIVLSFMGWLFFGNVLRRTSVVLMLLAFTIHTVALVLRMQISGRPPVTNLYSSAIFIGWAVVLASFVVEVMVKNGIGTILGASVGAGTLMIAHYLARDEGDTLGVMQAVLDTTFWLATHVVCITLGYAATFLAGVIGLFYCVQAMIGRPLSSSRPTGDFAFYLKFFGKLTYGTLCFALFFSLVGTVLGGLWADDSWGRFWGWDPKENGAMLIVLWNALILHARWDKMIDDYGTSVLAMLGNVVTAWSWFGVNELKAGLHTYGFTEGRLFALGLFAAVQLAIVVGFVLMASTVKSRRAQIKAA